MKDNLKKIPVLFDAALICTAIMLLVYAIKGIWPFGTENIFYDDMAQGAVPALYHLYDWLHGDKALNWDWYTGLGTNVLNFGNPTPLLIFLCFFKRENVYLAVNLFIVLKIAAAAITSKYCFRKLFPQPDGVWHTLFAVTYAMSTFTLNYYTNTSWLDFIVIFPLLIYGLKRLLTENKPFMYIFFLAVSLFYSVYHGYMILLSVFFTSALYIILLSEKGKRGHQACMLGLSTLAGGLTPCFAALPAALQTLSSKRFETGVAGKENIYLKILETKLHANYPQKIMLLIGLQLAFVLVFVFMVKLLRDRQKRKLAFVVGTLAIMFAPAFIEGINLIWHGGSYVGFPMRFLFISVFFLHCLCLAGITQYSETCFLPKKKSVRIILLIVAAALTLPFIFNLNCFAETILGSVEDTLTKTEVKETFFAALYAIGVPLFILLLFQKKYITQAFCLSLCLVQTFAVCYGLVGNSHEQEEEEYLYNSPSFLEYCQEAAQLDTDCGELGRIKNYDTSLNTNYPLIIGQAALSNWTHSIPLYTQKAASILGYGTQYTRVLDVGGTAFTDGILGVKKMIMRNHQPVTGQYRRLDRTENFSLYENLYAIDFGLLAGEEILEDITTKTVTDRFDVQNSLWQMFTNSEDKLFDICTRDEDGEKIKLTEKQDGKLVFKFTATGNEIVYINAGDYKKQSFKIAVNGERIMAAYHKYTEYIYYPSPAVNGILTLGSFSAGEEVEIVVECINGQSFGSKPVQIASMSLTKLNKLNNLYVNTVTNEQVGKSGLSFDYNNATGENRYLFVPVTYDKGFTCKINGEEARVHQALGAYIAVELPEGSGSVELKWQPQGQGVGIIMSVAGLLLCAFIFVFLKKDLQFPKFISKSGFVCLAVAFAGAIVLIYLIPGAASVYGLIMDILK